MLAAFGAAHACSLPSKKTSRGGQCSLRRGVDKCRVKSIKNVTLACCYRVNPRCVPAIVGYQALRVLPHEHEHDEPLCKFKACDTQVTLTQERELIRPCAEPMHSSWKWRHVELSHVRRGRYGNHQVRFVVSQALTRMF